MRSTQADELRAQIEQLESELAIMRGGAKRTPEAERRLEQIRDMLPRLREELGKLGQSDKLGS
jgi:hypothetical protein